MITFSPSLNKRSSLSRFIPLTLLCCGVLLPGCGGSKASETEAKTPAAVDPLADAPPWVVADCRDHFEGKAVLCGVGSVSGVSSMSLARNTAMSRGRTEISRYLSVELKSILTDFQAAKQDRSLQEIEEESTQISEMTLSGSRMAAYFRGKDGTFYALMALEYDSFKESIEASSTIDDELKRAIIENANKAFAIRDTEASRY